MRKFVYFTFLFISFRSDAFAQRDSIEATIIRFFDGLSEVNPAKLKEHCTADFLLLEVGEVWNMDTLISKISRMRHVNFKRVNTFSFIRTEQQGDIAWTSYHNTADFAVDDRKRSVNWLESAVLVREAGKWKIKLLHSTRK